MNNKLVRNRGWLICGLLLASSLSALAQEEQTVTPRWEAGGGYSYVRQQFFTPGINRRSNINGGSASVAYNLNQWVGLVGDVGAYHTSAIKGTERDFSYVSFMAGPRVSYRKLKTFTPFAQVLFGGVHGNRTIPLTSGGKTNFVNGDEGQFAMAAGAGIDATVNRNFAVRLIQGEYFLTKFHDGQNNRQDNVRITTGVLFRFGGR